MKICDDRKFLDEKSNDERWDDPYDRELSVYVTGAVAALKLRGLDPISCIEKITQSRPPIEENQLSWISAHMLIFIELKRQIYRRSFGDDCPF